MIPILLTCLIISNICHIAMRTTKNIEIGFVDTFISWNIITIVLFFWIYMYRPDSETLEWIVSFIR
jgi:hypothetical protein